MKLTQKLFCASALVGSLFATNAYADAVHEGFDLRLAPSAVIVAHSGPESGDMVVGANLTASIGYRFHRNVGAYFTQDLGFAWKPGEGDDYDYDDEEEGSSASFVGGSYAVVRGIVGVNYDDVEFSFGAGAGAMYGPGIGGGACFAIKLSVGVTYYVTDIFGIGVNVDYNLGFKRPSDEFEIDMHLIHQINPGILFQINF